MKSIITLTLNPAIDGASDAPRVSATHKIRTTNDRYNPGGGGINVARVVKRLGGDARAIYLAGGATGGVLDSLLDRDQITRTRLDIAGHTRISLAVHDQSSGLEYRFVPEGPIVSEVEWQSCLATMASVSCDYLVLSGSLPRGIPDDFYAQVLANAKGCKIILDTSGRALATTLRAGGVFLVKPSRGELEKLVGSTLSNEGAIVAAAKSIIAKGQAANVAVTMGHEGALLVDAVSVRRLPAIDVAAHSAVGAGDSFVGGMVFGLASSLGMDEAFKLAIAAATATVSSPGTDLCHKADVERFLESMKADLSAV
jgi:6-phosphofructokinase 2